MLESQRSNASFDVQKLSYVIYGNPQKFQQFLKMQSVFSSDPILKFNPQHLQISRKEKIQIICKQLVRYHQLFQFTPYLKQIEDLFFTTAMPLSTHFALFYSTLNNLCNEKQRQMFLIPTYKGQIYGCYAQTQLGHGSDLQNIQTTSTYDKANQTFILNSPTPSSIKWWIGQLGIFANHAIVMAQLIIENKRYGVQAFVLNIRDMKTHQPVKGIQIGDVGPKYGFNTKDNGFLKLNNVRIPRQNMLMKYSQVSKEGIFSRKGDERVTYATMLTTRAAIPKSTFYALSIAITIATRYSLVRKQFKSQDGHQIQILDYQLQQQKILPYIAQTYAVMFGSKQIDNIGESVIKQVHQHNNFSRLNPTHALSSALKAIFTSDTLKALQILRKSAGGHGFSQYARICLIMQQVAPAATYQGQNTVLLLQAARFLLKSFDELKNGKRTVDFMSYLEQVSKLPNLSIRVMNVQQLQNPQLIKKIMMHNSYQTLISANQKLMNGIGLGLSPKQSWDYHSGILLTETATAFAYYWIFNNFMQNVNKIQDHTLKIVLTKVLCLYGIQKILQNLKGYYEQQIIVGSGIKILFLTKQKLLRELRNESLTLVEAFCYDDNILKSAIGNRDGKAYETLLEWARNHNRVNRPEVQNELYNLLNESKKKISLKKSKL